jgi:hypothetical protein
VRVPNALCSLPYTRSLLVVDLDLEIDLVRVPDALCSLPPEHTPAHCYA